MEWSIYSRVGPPAQWRNEDIVTPGPNGPRSARTAEQTARSADGLSRRALRFSEALSRRSRFGSRVASPEEDRVAFASVATRGTLRRL